MFANFLSLVNAFECAMTNLRLLGIEKRQKPQSASAVVSGSVGGGTVTASAVDADSAISVVTAALSVGGAVSKTSTEAEVACETVVSLKVGSTAVQPHKSARSDRRMSSFGKIRVL